MSNIIPLVASILPIATLVILILFRRTPTHRAGIAMSIVTLLSATLVWQLSLPVISGAVVRGVGIALELIFIILFAITLLELLKRTGAIDILQKFLVSISPDKRIQAILIGWFFVSFIEGVAGFGTPAALAAPLLMAVGFSGIAAACIALIGDSVAVTFGAVGLPILLGIGEGAHGALPASLMAIGSHTALLHLTVAPLIPLSMAILASYFETGSLKQGFKGGLALTPYALVAGFAFMIPYYLTARFLGPEFPSIIGAIIGMCIMVPLTKHHILHRRPAGEHLPVHPPYMDVLRACMPYILALVILLITRIGYLPVGTWIKQFALSWPSIAGGPLSYAVSPLYSPGAVFLLVSLFVWYTRRLPSKDFKQIFSESVGKVAKPLVALVGILISVQLMLASEHNALGLPSMPIIGSSLLALTGGSIYTMLSPMVGLLGAFVAGSSTVSNLLFASFQLHMADIHGLNPLTILALQGVGSAVGNMIAAHNVVAVLTIVGLYGREAEVIKKNAWISIGYVLIAGIVALMFFV